MGDEEDPWDFIDPAPEIPRPLPLTDTDSDDNPETVESGPTTAPATPSAGTPVGEGAKAKGSAKRKPTLTVKKDVLDDLCDPQQAIRMYPAVKESVNETGIPADLLVTREQATTHAGGSLYLCRHSVCQSGTPFLAQSPAALYSHVRRKHLGIVLACPYCAHKVYWNTRGWKDHMKTRHRDAPHYGTALADEAKQAHQLLSPTLKTEPSSKPRGSGEQQPKVVPVETEDSSSDSSSSDSEGSRVETEASKKGAQPEMTIKPEPSAEPSYTPEQLEYVKEGAHALRGQPTLESLIKYPSAWKQPVPQAVAMRDLAVHPPVAQQVAASLVMEDILPSADPEVDPLADMPELEKTPPRKRSKQD